MRHTVEFDQDHAYLVLHFPAFQESHEDAAFELDFVIGRDYLITVHYDEIETLTKFALEPGSGLPFFGLLDALLSSLDDKLSSIDHWTRQIEKNMFSGKEKTTIFELSDASRHLIDFKKITAVYPESLQELADKGGKLFGQEFVNSIRQLSEKFERTQAKLELLSTAVHELRETNSSIVTTKQNETMRILTSVTVITTVLVGIALIWLGYLAVK